MSEIRKLFLIDVMPLLYRGHFVFLKTPRMTSTGVNTSSLTVFANCLLQILNEHEPTHVALVLDSTTPTFRHEFYPLYKAQRQKMPEDLAASIPMAIELADALQIPILRVDGFEADDVMGTLAARAAGEPGWKTYLVTPDKDAAQLVGPTTLLFRPGSGSSPVEIYDEATVCQHWGICSPVQMIDFLGLAGDASDNIPGIPGVGAKTAVTLLSQYGDMETILAHAADLKGKLAEKVANGAASARQSRELAAIRTDVPLDLSLDELARKPPDTGRLREVLQKYELHATGKRLMGDAYTVSNEVEESTHALADTPHTYVCVRSQAQLQKLLEELSQTQTWAFDTETTGLDPRHDRLVGLSFATHPGTAWYVPVPESREACCEFLKPFVALFADPFKIKIGHHAKFDLTILRQYGIECYGELHDTMLAHYVLDASDRHGMDYLAQNYLHYTPIPITALIGEKKKGSFKPIWEN